MRCSECGARKRLTRDGVCAWRAGCEHRVRAREGRERRVVEDAEQVVAHEEVREFFRHLGFRLPEDDQ